jgi:hypothetical protein
MIEQRLFTTPQTETTSDDYYTPKWIFDTLGLHFDLDVASPPHATNVPCDRYFTQADDGLSQDWHGRVWMNPPFSHSEKWVDRWIEHSNGIALLPLVKNTGWGTKLWNSNAAVHFPSFELKFEKDGKDNQRIWPPVWLWAKGDDNIEALHNFGTVR